MERRQLDVLIPMVFGLAVAATAIWGSGGALTAVAVIGGGLVGIYYAVFRGKMIRDAGEGRDRERYRDR